jgi:hypothetical protein
MGYESMNLLHRLQIAQGIQAPGVYERSYMLSRLVVGMDQMGQIVLILFIGLLLEQIIVLKMLFLIHLVLLMNTSDRIIIQMD